MSAESLAAFMERWWARNAAEREAAMASPNRPGYCRPKWGCRWCKAGECGWDARRPTETPRDE